MKTEKYWLMKAEPDSRVVKGKDVKFSVDDFEEAKTTAWEGVRNHQAKNYMKSMHVGDKILFYHSNCKEPGIAGFAHVVREAYPDYTAWDPDHPYYDQKTDKDKPTWHMVDLDFDARCKNFVPLALLRGIAAGNAAVGYLSEDGAKAVKEMELVGRGRLSVQRVEEDAYEVIRELAEKGGWDVDAGKKSKASGKPKKADQGEDEPKRASRKRKAGEGQEGTRRSTRTKRE
ncbi:unnamed protein product [Peniophora sp. CBMAI 1063]|nr:unnamed protein product [Peniophora sp. CBMAI 1063]